MTMTRATSRDTTRAARTKVALRTVRDPSRVACSLIATTGLSYVEMSVRKSAVFGLVALVSWVAAGAVGYHAWQNFRAGAVSGPPRTAVVVQAPTPTSSAPPTPVPTPTPLPASLSIQGVPFTIQAPFQVWDRAHQEYCEAAAVY